MAYACKEQRLLAIYLGEAFLGHFDRRLKGEINGSAC